jgi:hypothetical protein
MPQVNIPSGYFHKLTKQEYYNHESRLIAELIQNSVDAGATRIDLNFDDTSYTCIDNGHGMTEDRMVEALLTMGASIKSDGSTGGFGHAKICLLFQHESYTIHSLGTKAVGSSLEYEFADCEFLNGTSVSATFSEEYSYNKYRMVNYAEEFLGKCDLHCDVYLNGERFVDWLRLPQVKDEPWAVIHSKDKKPYGDYIYVRKNGLYMFYQWVHGIDKIVVVEAKGESVDIFSQNRDSFRGDYKTYYDLFVQQVINDKKGFLSPKPRKILYRGESRFWSTIKLAVRDAASAIKATIDECLRGTIDEIVDDIAKCVDVFVVSEKGYEVGRQEHIEVANRLNTLINQIPVESVKTAVETLIMGGIKKQTQVDFIVNLADSKYSDVPRAYDPNFGKEKHKFLARLWKLIIEEVMTLTNIEANYIIGWTFATETEASAQWRESDNRYEVLLNPEIFGKRDNLEELVSKLRAIGLHETTHVANRILKGRSVTSHDEYYASLLTDLTGMYYYKAKNWRHLVKTARDIAL